MPTYTYATLNDPSGTNGTTAHDINDVGQIVGVFQDSNNIQHGFLYSNGTYTTLNDPSAATPNGVGGLGTYANSINGSGQIVGYYADGTGVNHGFLYSGGTNGTYTTLDDPSASGAGTVTFGINDLGQIVGYCYSTPTALLYSGGTNGTYTTINASGLFTSPLGINDSGQIVGYYRDANGNNQGFLDSNGTFTTLAVPGASGTNTVARGINDAGQIVGSYLDSSGIEHGFLYSGGTYTTLDDPSTTAGTAAVGINDSGQIVGYYEDLSGTHGFLASLSPPSPASITSVTDNVAPLTGTLTNGSSTNDPDPIVQVSLSGTGALAGNTVQLYNGTGTGNPLGSSYTLTSTDIGNGFANVQTGTLTNGTTYTLTVRMTDAAGNQSAVSTNSFTLTEDTTPPTVAVSISSSDVNLAANTATVTFVFSDATMDFSILGSTSAIGGTLSNLQTNNGGNT
jgi:probable HAF family extracellular repeat protein